MRSERLACVDVLSSDTLGENDHGRPDPSEGDDLGRQRGFEQEGIDALRTTSSGDGGVGHNAHVRSVLGEDCRK